MMYLFTYLVMREIKLVSLIGEGKDRDARHELRRIGTKLQKRVTEAREEGV